MDNKKKNTQDMNANTKQADRTEFADELTVKGTQANKANNKANNSYTNNTNK